ncbi:hypothetical protein PR048_007047 [Dryococelus australis]|uniref:Uncharacterized protein n=1 Tax=Dryococelus australis TaxID=614101 RepID=A0ABQ9IDJ4_9NEOP|nr:hypothetical protein PR048_007047 [Dryococelus australis]
MPLVGGFSSGISRFPRLFVPALLHTTITLIGSQYLAVKSRPIFSLTPNCDRVHPMVHASVQSAVLSPHGLQFRAMCCETFVAKYCLCIFNFLFFLAGAAALGVGIWIAQDKHSFIAVTQVIENKELQIELVAGWNWRCVAQVADAVIALGVPLRAFASLKWCGGLRAVASRGPWPFAHSHGNEDMIVARPLWWRGTNRECV